MIALLKTASPELQAFAAQISETLAVMQAQIDTLKAINRDGPRRHRNASRAADAGGLASKQ